MTKKHKRVQRQEVPSQEYLDILGIMACGEFPSEELLNRFLTYDPIMPYVSARIMDWMLWRMRHGRVFERLASDDSSSIALMSFDNQKR
jgi:hypothetical protein